MRSQESKRLAALPVRSRWVRANALALALLFAAGPSQARDVVELMQTMFATTDQIPGPTLGHPKAGNAFQAGYLAKTTELAQQLQAEATSQRGFIPNTVALTYDLDAGKPVRSTDFLGSIMAERPNTIGKRRFSMGVSYEERNFETLNGQDLSSIRLVADHDGVVRSNDTRMAPDIDDPSVMVPIETNDKMELLVDAKLKQDFIEFFLNYGITDNIEVGIAFPLVQTIFQVGITASLMQFNVNGTPSKTGTQAQLNWDSPLAGQPNERFSYLFANQSANFHYFCAEIDNTTPHFNFIPGGTIYSLDPILPGGQASRKYRDKPDANFFNRTPNRPARPGGGGFDPNNPDNFAPQPAFPYVTGNTYVWNSCIGGPDSGDRTSAAFNDGDVFPQLFPDTGPNNQPLGIEKILGHPDWYGGAVDGDSQQAFGVGDLRLRGKWHALHADGWIPDLALLIEYSTSTGRSDDLFGTGNEDFFFFLATGAKFWRFYPHINAGYELSSGGKDYFAFHYVGGVDMRIFDWLMLSVDGTGRLSQGDLIRSRYEIGGGVKFSPAPGMILYANVVRPYPRDSGLREKFSWRVGGQIEF